MKLGSQIYWIIWFVVGFGLPEILGLRHPDFSTLSETWTWIVDAVPPVVSYAMYIATAVTLSWLLFPHWILNRWDNPGISAFDSVFLLLGVIVGFLGAVKRKKPTSES